VLAGVAAYEATTATRVRRVLAAHRRDDAAAWRRQREAWDRSRSRTTTATARSICFVGARIYPGLYPLSPSSHLYHNINGRLVLDSANDRLFYELGWLSAPCFSDIDGDGDPGPARHPRVGARFTFS